MLNEWRQRRALRRVKPGDGRELQPFRWWQQLLRALFHLRAPDATGRWTIYAVNVRHGQNQGSGNVKAELYVDGRQHAVCRLPAVFPVEGGTIEVSMSGFGLKRCHYVTHEGHEHQLTPDPASAEGRRANLARQHPTLSRVIGCFSAVALTTALVLLVSQVAEELTEPPEVAQHVGTFHAPVHLSVWMNITLVFVTLASSTERALRLHYSRLLDGGAG
ncbi:hypothetical protein OG402_38765 [Streptomyces anulatus]|uniref:hypothetical protein n=1 Tax=Streptomyces anulatus TaxID=1892 RepID=UPI00224FB21C|nr:hypothetical protein [Streptomyces anulatus]MCX4523375.1 hypothetical protein [Streptomyces anulatus]MCX4606385.1 hypothetical protein [Streptomyces anulatus]